MPPTGGAAGPPSAAPPVGEFSWMEPRPSSDDGSDVAPNGMADVMGDDWWIDGSDTGSWSPNGDGSSHDSDSDMDGSHYGYSSGSDLGLMSQDVPGGSGSGSGSDLDLGLGSSGASDHGTSDGGGGGSSSGDDHWAAPDDPWFTMHPDETDSLSSDSYESGVVPPPVGHGAHAHPPGAAPGGWGGGADMVTNPAAHVKRELPPLSSGPASAKRPRASAAAAARGMLAEPEEQATRATPRVPVGTSLRWEEALYLLDQGAVSVRPSRLKLMPGAMTQIFLERPVQKRKKGDDKWVGSGGRKGSTEYWTSDHVGVRKRYGRVTCEGDGAMPLKYAHYTRLRRKSPQASGAAGADGDAIEDKTVALFAAIPTPSGEVRPPMKFQRGGAAAAAPSIPLPQPVTAGAAGGMSGKRPGRAGGALREHGASFGAASSASIPASPSSSASAAASAAASASAPAPAAPPPKRARGQAKVPRLVPAPHVFTADGTGADGGLSAALTVQAGPAGRFISFRDAGGTGPNKDRELGAFVRHNNGVKLVSTQGDFAEWHRRAEGEAPFESGDVVAFRNGVISRVIHRSATMLGVVSRMAVIEGSLPPKDVRHLYDTVAYAGVVPVKLSMSPPPKAEDFYTGAVLRPSGYNDGTAVLVSREKLMEEAERRGIYAGTAAGRVGVLLGSTEGGTELVTAPLVAGPRAEGHKLVTALVVNPTETVPLPQACCDLWLRRLGDLIWGLIAIVAVMLALMAMRSLGWISLDKAHPL